MTTAEPATAERTLAEPAGGDRLRRADLIVLLGLVAIAALLRLPGLAARGGWDADQGSEMIVLWRLIHDGQIPLVGPPTSIGDLHHGALYYFLLAPFAWISNGDPRVVVGAIALGGVAAVGVTWWLARSIGGPVAGLVAGLLIAVSTSAVTETTIIWNPSLVALSSSVALAGAWQAQRTGRAKWWILAAGGLVVTMQCHVLGIVLAPPLVGRFLLDLRRSPAGESRKRLLGAGLAAVLVVVIGYLPLIAHELGSGFSETRAALAFVGAGGQAVALSLPARLLFVGLRIVAWPLVGSLTDHLGLGALVGVATLAGIAWRAIAAAQPGRGEVRFLGATLVFGWLILGVGVGSMATVTLLPVDQYHAFLDPIVFVGVGVTIAALWRLARAMPSRMVARGLVAAATAGLVVFNLANQPPSPALDGGWPAAEQASQQILAATGGDPIELRGLPAFKGTDAYGFALVRAGASVAGTIDTPTPWSTAAARSASGTGAVAGEVPAAVLASGGAIVTICDALFVADCGGPAEAAAVPATGFRLADRFPAAPGRTISVYLPGGR